MKHLIFAVLERHDVTEEVLTSLSHHGYNGTVVASTSLKHTLTNGGEIPMFVNLSSFESDRYENNTTLFIVVEENQVNDVLDIIRRHTKNFTTTKGGMFSFPLSTYEGSF